MAARQEWFTVQELAGMPGMPGTQRGCLKWLQKNLAVCRPKGRAKGLEYSRDSLPEQTQEHLQKLDLQAVLKLLPTAGDTGAPGTDLVAAQTPAAQSLPAVRQATAVAVPESPEDSTSDQRHRDLARRLVLGTMRRLQVAAGCSVRQSAALLLEHARTGQLQPVMLAKLREACDERGRLPGEGEGFPSAVTLTRWHRLQAAGKSLAPRASAAVDLRVRGWYRPFFALTDRPQKPTLKWAHEQLLSAWRPEWSDPPGSPPPSYDAVRLAYAKRSKTDRLRGRHTGSALRSKVFYHRRTYHGLAPGDEVHADGWTTHFTAPDPKTGAYVTYEVWHFHDTATRWVPPMAVGMTENTDVILQGLEHCIRALGVPGVWQTDHTSSVKNARVMDEHAGLADRIGFTVVHPQQVGNSQANGIAENFNTWLDRQSRELATYQHPDRMDSGTFVRVRRITNAMVRAADKPVERAQLRAQAMKIGKGIVFDTHAEALAWLEAQRQKWNSHPHRELPKVRDEATGRMVHMTPQQSLDAARAAGWQPVAMTDAEIAEEFRPHLRKKVTRGTVSPYGGMRYHHEDLAHHEGEEVLVCVDRHDPTHVWVKDHRGQRIAQARFVAAVGPRTESMAEHVERRRAEGQIKRRENQIAQIEDRLAPPAIELDAGEGVLRMPDPAIFERVPATRYEPAEPSAEERLAQVIDVSMRANEHAKREGQARDYLDQMADLMERITAIREAEAEALRQQEAEERRRRHEQQDNDEAAQGGGG